MTLTTPPDRATAVLLAVHILAMFGGFLLLGPAFDFPEVLRYPAEDRFALFRANAGIIRPTYWVLTMTGLSQIALAVLLVHVAGAPSRASSSLALVFGSLAGLCQAAGFGRWVITIPWLAEQAAIPGQATQAALMEGVLNHYAGMVLGEHLANICWGIWLVSVNLLLLRATDLDRRLCWLGLALAPLMLLLAGEQVGLAGPVLGALVDLGFPLLAVWHLGLAAMLWRRAGRAQFPPLGRALPAGGAALALLMMAPLALG